MNKKFILYVRETQFLEKDDELIVWLKTLPKCTTTKELLDTLTIQVQAVYNDFMSPIVYKKVFLSDKEAVLEEAANTYPLLYKQIKNAKTYKALTTQFLNNTYMVGCLVHLVDYASMQPLCILKALSLHFELNFDADQYLELDDEDIHIEWEDLPMFRDLKDCISIHPLFMLYQTVQNVVEEQMDSKLAILSLDEKLLTSFFTDPCDKPGLTNLLLLLDAFSPADVDQEEPTNPQNVH